MTARWLLAATLVVGCGDGGAGTGGASGAGTGGVGTGGAGTGGVGTGGAGMGGAGTGEVAMGLFAWPPDATDFYALPFPNELRVSGGHLDLSGLERDDGLVGQTLDNVMMEYAGFANQGGVYFRFTAPLDPATLSAQSVFLVDLDSGQRHVAVRTKYEDTKRRYLKGNGLSVLPFPGFPLHEGASYAAVVTTDVKGKTGQAVTRDPRLDTVLAAPPNEPYRKLVAWLTAHPDVKVAVATAFSTQNASVLSSKWRDAAAAQPAPAGTISTGPTEGPSRTYDIYDGAYQGPMFQQGTSPFATAADGGRAVYGADGRPTLQGLAQIDFSLTIPRGTRPPGGWPLVVYAHGTGGDHRSFVNDGTAETLAEVKDAQGQVIARFAVASIDQCVHGTRNPAHSNEELNFFNLLNVQAARNNVLQCGADQIPFLHMLQGLSQARPEMAFDASRTYYMGHSQGSITGPQFLAYEPAFKGFVLSGGGANFLLALTAKTEPLDIPAIVTAALADGDVDELHPMLSLLQTFIEPADPGNHARLLFQAPAAGMAARPTYISLGLVDHYTPVSNGRALALASGVQVLGPLLDPIPGLDLTGLPLAAAPVRDNVAGGTVTGIAVQYRAPRGHDGHFVVFDVLAANQQYSRFLATLAATGHATLLP